MSGKRREAGLGEPLAIASEAFNTPGLSAEREPLHMRALEPRILLDAAAVETAEDAMVEAVHGPLADAYLQHEFKPIAPFVPQTDVEDDELIDPTSAPLKQIAFIAADVADIDVIVADLSSDTEIVLLTAQEDGVARIAEVLDGRTGLDAIHIVSHGRAGALSLGTATLDATTMAGVHADRLRAIGASLGEAGDILLYGCNFAEGETGEAAAQLLADLTGADIAASDDTTGHTALGGDWTLERQTGAIEAETLDAGLLWNGVLATKLESYEGGVDGFSDVDKDDTIRPGERGGQTFVHNNAAVNGSLYTLEEVELGLRREDGTADRDIEVTIRTSWNGPVLATATIPSTDITNAYEWHLFTFATPVTLTSGVSYVLRIENNSTDQEIEMATDKFDPYGNGNIIRTDGSVKPNHDAFFRLYGTEGTTNADPVITSNGGGAFADIDVDENETFITNVVATDPDPGATLTYSLGSSFEESLFQIDATTGQLSFRDAPDFENVSSPSTDNQYRARVEVSDGNGGVAVQTIDVYVQDVNEAPVIFDNATTSNISIVENTTAVSTVVANDQDPGPTLTYSLATTGESNLFRINAATGALSFRVAPNFENPSNPSTDNSYDVTVIVDDGQGGVDTQLITVTVTNENEDPAIISFGGAPTVYLPRSENDTEVATIRAIDFDAGDTITFGLNGGEDESRFTIDPATGVLSFITAPDFENPTGPNADQIYEVWVEARDQFGGRDSQFVQVTIGNVNEAPTGTNVAWSGTTLEDTDAVGRVTMTDPDAGDIVEATIGTGPSNGSVAINTNTGQYRYTPDQHYVGSDQFTVVVSDAAGLTDTVTIDITVTASPDAPEAANQSLTTPEDTQVSGTLVMTDPDAGDTPEATLDQIPTNGVAVVQTNGDFTYTPDDDFVGSDSFTILVTDDTGRTTTATISVDVAAANDAPEITSDGGGNTASVTVVESTSAVTTVVASDPDAGQTPRYTISGGADGALFEIDEVSGALEFRTAPDFENPQSNAGDNTYSVVVEADDGLGGVDFQTITVTVTDRNDTPVFTNDGGAAVVSTSLAENTTYVTTLTAQDADAGDTLAFTIIGGADAARFTLDAVSGDLEFIDAPDFENPADAGADNLYDLIVQVDDGRGGTATQTLDIAIRSANEAPTISGLDTLTTLEEAQVTGSVTMSDTDAGDELTASLGKPAQNGTATVATDGTFAYQPDTDFAGTDTFDITVTDAAGRTDTLSINVTVTGTNDAPVISATSLTISEDTAASAMATITDPDTGDTYVASISTQPDNGTASVTSSGRYSYTPNANFFGTDTFVLTVTDRDGATDTVTIDVTVTPVNDAPVANGGTANAMAGESTRLSADTFAFDDIEGDDLTSVTLSAFDLAGGTLVHSGNVVVSEGATLTMAELETLVFTPASDAAAGEATFAYTANDATSGVTPGTFRIDVAAAPPPPPTPEPEPEPEPEPVTTFVAPTSVPVVEEADDTEEETESEEEETPVVATDAIQPDTTPNAQASAAPPARPGVVLRETEVAAAAAPAAPEPDLDVQLSTPAPLPVRETVIEPATAPIQINRAGITFTPVDQQALAQDVDRTGEEMRDYDDFLGVAVDKVSFAFGSLLSVGGVSFALRGGVLAAALMSAVPAWNRFDPIAIVNQDGEESEEPSPTLADTMRAAIEDARGRVETGVEEPA